MINPTPLCCHPRTPLQVKVWNIAENKPALLASQNLNVGAVFSMGFCRWVGGGLAGRPVWGGNAAVLLRSAADSTCIRDWHGLMIALLLQAPTPPTPR